MTTRYQIQPKRYYREQFDGSDGLFDYCWRRYRAMLPHIDNPACDLDVIEWLDAIAAEAVNNSQSRYFIYG